MIRHIAKGERDGDLNIEANGRQCVGRQGSETEAVDNGRRVSVEGSLRAVVG